MHLIQMDAVQSKSAQGKLCSDVDTIDQMHSKEVFYLQLVIVRACRLPITGRGGGDCLKFLYSLERVFGFLVWDFHFDLRHSPEFGSLPLFLAEEMPFHCNIMEPGLHAK